MMAACSSSTPSPPGVAPGIYLRQSGSGNTTSVPVTLPATWAGVWTFHCPGATTRQPFTVTAHPGSGNVVPMTHQVGIGGAGRNIFNGAGSYTFVVATTCQWTLAVTTPAASATTVPVTSTSKATTTTKG